MNHTTVFWTIKVINGRGIPLFGRPIYKITTVSYNINNNYCMLKEVSEGLKFWKCLMWKQVRLFHTSFKIFKSKNSFLPSDGSAINWSLMAIFCSESIAILQLFAKPTVAYMCLVKAANR